MPITAVHWFRAGLGLGALLVLGCGVPPSESSAPVTSPPATTPSAADQTARLDDGRYCYGIDSETLTGVVRLTIDGGQITGDSNVTIHNQAAGYYSAYVQQLEGILHQGEASMDIRTWIEYDQQESEEIWQISPDQLQTEQETFNAIDCEQANERWQGPEGMEAAELLNAADTLNTQRVEFDLGATAATLENSVVRGERDLYLVNAQGGQMMELELTSAEDNAVLDVITPSGLILERNATQAQLLLPHTGDYRILVGGTRGNASYQLRIQIDP